MRQTVFPENYHFWVLEHREELQLEEYVHEYTWEGRPRFWAQCKATFEGTTFGGQGSAGSAKGAFLIAVTECLERMVTKKAGFPHSNGVAAHFVKSEAERNARDELIERDSYFTHWYGSFPPYYRESISHGKEILPCYELASSEGFLKICMTYRNLGDGHVLGLGTGESWDKARQKALSETMMISMAAHELKIPPLTFERFCDTKQGPLEHLAFALSQDADLPFKKWLKTVPSIPIDDLSRLIQKPIPSCQDIPWNLSIPSPELFVSRADPTKHVRFFFGNPVDHTEELDILRGMVPGPFPAQLSPHTLS